MHAHGLACREGVGVAPLMREPASWLDHTLLSTGGMSDPASLRGSAAGQPERYISPEEADLAELGIGSEQYLRGAVLGKFEGIGTVHHRRYWNGCTFIPCDFL